LPVYDDRKNITDLISVKIDGEKIKENTYYWIKDGELVEYIEE
jgi:hypothetical protein